MEFPSYQKYYFERLKQFAKNNETYVNLYKVVKKKRKRLIPTHFEIQRYKSKINRFEKEAKSYFLELTDKGLYKKWETE